MRCLLKTTKTNSSPFHGTQEKIDQEMNGPNYRHLDRRKREIYRKYLDYSNKKVGDKINYEHNY